MQLRRSLLHHHSDLHKHLFMGGTINKISPMASKAQNRQAPVHGPPPSHILAGPVTCLQSGPTNCHSPLGSTAVLRVSNKTITCDFFNFNFVYKFGANVCN
ncbi:hypothetical protein GDO78_001260 [Eleutherodactylus coqui]|uniref:Uncharacterized protein n=1 Tax=Eleutherodactylus coqui TaxID=57060 RepID=A0A8J6FT21_ELECQ|nr:hypothetical protein GDO78_001260 [Eleutherodactylus coqui]